MRVTIFGATGRTGVPLTEQALAHSHEVTAFVRDASKLEMSDDKLLVVEGDAYTGEGIDEAVKNADAVLSVLGQTSSGPDDLLTVAGNQILEAMERHDVDRFVTLVGAGVRVEGESVSLTGRIIGGLLKLMNPEVLEDAENHVEDIQGRELEWTIVRAPRLSEDEPRGDYQTGDVAPGRKPVPRADVADFMLKIVENDRYIHELPKIAY